MVCASTGHVYTRPCFAYLENEVQNTIPFLGLRHEGGNFMEHACLDDATRLLTWVVFEFHGATFGEEVCRQLTALDCDIVGVGRIAGDHMAAICRRTKITKGLTITGAPIGMVLSAVIQRQTNPKELIITIVRSWVRMCTTVYANFDIKLIAVPTMTSVLEEWKDLSERQILEQLASAKAKISRKRSAREAFITSVKPELLAALRCSLVPVSTIRFSALDDHVSLASIVPPPSQLVLRTYDPSTGAMIYSSLREWGDGGLFAERSLVIHGLAQCAKTPLARAVCAYLAGALQRDSGSEPFYLKVGTADSLRTAMKDGQMQMGVPILFDEVTPAAGRGSRVSMSIEDVKHMTESADTSALDGRNSDIVFARLMPKIFTSNAASPHAWFPDLPIDIFTMTDAQRLALPANVAAVFKRCFFLHLTSCVIPPAVIAAHRQANRDSLSARIALGPGPRMV